VNTFTIPSGRSCVALWQHAASTAAACVAPHAQMQLGIGGQGPLLNVPAGSTADRAAAAAAAGRLLYTSCRFVTGQQRSRRQCSCAT